MGQKFSSFSSSSSKTGKLGLVNLSGKRGSGGWDNEEVWTALLELYIQFSIDSSLLELYFVVLCSLCEFVPLPWPQIC